MAACGNIADELGCNTSTHFYCDDYTLFVSRRKLFDGINDCNDFTDECNITDTSVSSQTHLVGSDPLRICLWILMLLSLIGNGIVIGRTVKELLIALRRRLHCSINRVGVCNKIMILNLAVSDFLMGIYLLIIAIKNAEFSGSYCREQRQWLLSSSCAFAGILAVISSEASAFLMVLMTSYRLYGVTNPFRAEKLRCKIIYFATGVVWVVSLLLAIIPIFPSLRLKFASAIVVDHPYRTNILTITSMSQLIRKANRLPGSNLRIPEPSTLDIQTFCSLFVNRSLPSYCDNLNAFDENYIQGFYASDGVCLPR